MDLSGKRDAAPPVSPSISVLRSVRAGETQNPAGPGALAMPQRCVDALSALWDKRSCEHADRTRCDCLVFTTRVGTPLDARNVRRHFRKVARAGVTSSV